MTVDVFGTHVPQAENDNAGQIGTTGRKEIAKIEVVSQEDVALLVGLRQYLRIAESIEALLLKMNSLMPKTLKKTNHTR
jgi:hypothetical protein